MKRKKSFKKEEKIKKNYEKNSLDKDYYNAKNLQTTSTILQT